MTVYEKPTKDLGYAWPMSAAHQRQQPQPFSSQVGQYQLPCRSRLPPNLEYLAQGADWKCNGIEASAEAAACSPTASSHSACWSNSSPQYTRTPSTAPSSPSSPNQNQYFFSFPGETLCRPTNGPPSNCLPGIQTFELCAWKGENDRLRPAPLSPPRREDSAPAPYNRVLEGRVRKKPRYGKCNRRYTKEQLHFFRYHRLDRDLPWDTVVELFHEQWPEEHHSRQGNQGAQGLFYRENSKLPKLDFEANSFCYMENGHVEVESVSQREQNDKKNLYHLCNLFPEYAMSYPWVLEEDQARARALHPKRSREREQAKQKAIARGLWREVLPEGECFCCLHSKRR